MYFSSISRFLLLVGIITLIGVVADRSYAQVDEFIAENSLAINISPQFPGPGEQVTLTLVSNSIDFNRTTIVWRVNGAVIAEGVGEKSVEVVAGDEGETTAVTVELSSPTIGTIDRLVEITPGSVDLLWETPDATHPPFYKGKTLPAAQSYIRLAAFPVFQGGQTPLTPQAAVYRWTKNGVYRHFNNQSGFGKYFITFTRNIFEKTETVGVEVESVNGNRSAAREIVFAEEDPLVFLYEQHPLQGTLYNKALIGTVQLNKQEITLRAVPYFFTRGGVTYDWEINGSPVPAGENGTPTLTLRREGEGAGRATVSVEIEHIQNPLLSARTSVVVSFSQ